MIDALSRFRLRHLGCALLLVIATQAFAAIFVGRRVADVLDELRSAGLTFIYNTDLVADDLRVAREPTAVAGAALAREILHSHGLELKEVAPGTFAVVKAAHAAASEHDVRPSDAPRPAVEEVVVQTSRYALAADIAGSHTFLDQMQLMKLPRLGDETLQAVQRLPGVATNGVTSIGPIRGGVPDETAIVFDGLRLYEPFHFKSYQSPISLLDSRFVAGLDVYFGGFPAEYGDRMSAIIDARSVRSLPPRYYELGLSLFHANALYAASFDDDRAHLLASARRSNLGEVSRMADNDIGRPNYADGFARFDYQFSDATRASLSTLLSHDRVTAIRASGTERAYDESSNGYLWATLEHTWSDAMTSRAILSWTHVTDERSGRVADPGRREGTVRDDRAFNVIGLRIDNEWRATTLTHRFGAEARRLWADYEYAADTRFAADFPFPDSPPSTLVRSTVLHPDGFEASGYWDTRWTPGGPWVVQGGLRVDTQTYDESADSAQWSPRLSVLYNVSEATRVRASWGQFHQSQSINELQVEDGVDHFHPAQLARHSIFSIEHTFVRQLDARLELYRKDYRQLSPRFENLLDPLVLLPELAFDRVRIAPQSARADGAELWLNWHPSNQWNGGDWSGWLSYTWSQVRDRIDGIEVARSWDQRHAISLGLAWTHGPWAVTLADTYHSGWPTTAFQQVTPAGVVAGERNTRRYEAFNSLDLRVTRTFTLPRGELDVFVEAANLTSRENPCCTEYRVTRTADGTLALTSDTDSWLPLVPSFGVLWRYGKE